MAGSLKGSLGLKSSPLAPTSAKLTTQYLVLDHMNNHYKKIATAKSAVDNHLPKSMLCSQKVRERKQREDVIKYGRPLSRLSNRTGASPTPSGYYIMEDEAWGEPEDEKDRLVHNIMKTTLQREPEDSIQATFNSEQHEHQLKMMGNNFGKTVRHGQTNLFQENINKLHRPCSARSTHSVLSNSSRTSLDQTKKPGTYDGDLLEKRAHIFTKPEKPFTPRTLKSNRQSRLKEYKYYTSPPKKRHDGTVDKDQSHGLAEPSTQPQPKPRKRGDSQKGEMLETTLMFESLQSHDFNYLNKKHQDGIPTLDISVDKDHQDWLQEQATKAHVRMKSEKMASCKESKSEMNTVETRKTFLDDDTDLTVRKSIKSFDKKLWKSQRLSKVEEEQLYVRFAQDITKDVLNSGICSDRVLQQVFERHLQKNKERLKMTRMRTILSKLRLDLGVRKDDPDDEPGTDLAAISSLRQANILEFGEKKTSLQNEISENLYTSYEFDDNAEVLITVRSQREADEPEKISSTQVLEQYQIDMNKMENDNKSQVDVSDKNITCQALDLKSAQELSQTSSELGEVTPIPSVTASPTHVPKQRPRERRHAKREKINSATDDENMSLKDSETSVNTTLQQVLGPEVILVNENTIAESSSVSSMQVQSPSRRRLRKKDVSTADNNSVSTEKVLEEKQNTVPLVSSSQHASEIQTPADVHKSESQQNEDDTHHTAKKDEYVFTKENEEQNDYDDDYEDDYDADEDEHQGDTTHRTSDDDF